MSWRLCATQSAAALALPQLYKGGEFARLDIQNGVIQCAALHAVPGLGVPVWPDLQSCRALDAFVPDDVL